MVHSRFSRGVISSKLSRILSRWHLNISKVGDLHDHSSQLVPVLCLSTHTGRYSGACFRCQVIQYLLQMDAKLSLEIVKPKEQIKILLPPPPPPKLMSRSTFSHSTLSILDQKHYLVKVNPTSSNTNACCKLGFQVEKIKIYILLIVLFSKVL